MHTGLVLFYVGAVLILNGLWMLERIGDREIFVINALVGLLSLRVAHEQAFGQDATLATVREATLSLLFAFTYLWVACNRLMRLDGRGLGWFSLFIAVSAAVVAGQTLAAAHSPWALWSGLSWAAWALLWGLFFMQLVRGKPWSRPIGWLAIAQGIATGWLPGFWLLNA
ncbi:MAG: hypothetical protein RJA36_2495 [Pseudomonadota bacterium]